MSSLKTRDVLHGYQKKIIELIKQKKTFGLFLDPGCGKTIIILTAIKDLLDAKLINKVCIVAPIQVCKDTWPKEIEKWKHLSNIKYQVCLGSEKKRLEALNTDASIYIINRENISWLVKAKRQISWLAQSSTIAFDMLVIDESSSFKNPAAQRFKAIKKYFSYKYAVCASGTPSPNDMADLWAQIYILDKGERLGNTFYTYTNMYFDYNKYQYKYICRKPEEIKKKISDICYYLKAEDYLEMPALRFNNIYITIPDLKEYNKYRRDAILNINGQQITAVNTAVLINKLLQYCNGAIYYNDKLQYVEVHDAKLNMLESLIHDNSNENFLVAYNFQSDLERLKKRFKQAVVLDGSKEIIDQWNQKKIPLLLAHPASSSKGLNLQFGGSNIVWFSLTYNLENYLQFNARLYRQGQSKPVIIHNIIAKSCIDEIVLQALKAKEEAQATVLNFLKLEMVEA